jgi:hypothetical protein
VLPATHLIRGEAAAVGDPEPETREAVEDATEDQLGDRDGRLHRDANEVLQVVDIETVATRD